MEKEITDWRKAEKDFKNVEKLKKKKAKEAKQEQKIEEQNRKMAILESKKQKRYERGKRKLQLQQLKRETSISGRTLTALREQQRKIKLKTRQPLQTVQKPTRPTSQKKIGKAGEDFIVINGHLYEHKGTVATQKPKKIKKPDESEGITI